MPPRFIAEQLSHPRGLRGWLVRRGMNRGNARANAFALDQLALMPKDKVLEVGFGGGVNIERLLDQSASVVGVDRSKDAVAAADRRFATARSAGRARFLLGDVEALPLADNSSPRPSRCTRSTSGSRSIEGFGNSIDVSSQVACLS